MSKVPYAKPALSLDQQIELMRGRGLVIDDEAAAQRHLETISYYRLSGYTRYFTDANDDRRERFRPGVNIEDVIALYSFDRRMRTLLSEGFERVEVAVKGGIAYHGSTIAGPFWITDSANFDRSRHAEIMKLVCDAVLADGGKQHKTQFLDHFYRKYDDPYPPAWMITEVLSFHGASKVYQLARGSIRREIGAQFDVQQDILESWLHALVFARNVCAHHGRFWNRRFTIRPKIPHSYASVWPNASQNRLYVLCGIVHHLLQHLGGTTTWPGRLRTLMAERPSVLLSDMGFPDDWEAKAFWGFAP